MTTGSHIGKTVYIATAAPATNDDAGFEALTWVEIAGWQVLPQFGISNANIDVPDGKSGFTSGLKGAASGNDSTMSFRDVSGDAGQAALRTAADAGGAGGIVSIKVGKGSGTDNALTSGDPVEYAHGYVHSFVKIQGDTTTHEGFGANFKQNGLTIEDTEPA